MLNQLRVLTSVFILLTSLQAWAVFDFRIEGRIVRENNQLSVQMADLTYRLTSEDATNSKILDKMISGDWIVGLGELNSETKTISVRTVEFVGLKNLLGLWQSQNQYFNFKDFTNLYLYFNLDGEGKRMTRKSVQYTMAPGSGTEWKIFIVDEKYITLSSLRIDGNSATLTLFNSDTGEVAGQVHMKKFLAPIRHDEFK